MRQTKTLEDIDTGRGFVIQQGALVEYEDIEWHYNSTFPEKGTAGEFFRDVFGLITKYYHRVVKKEGK